MPDIAAPLEWFTPAPAEIEADSHVFSGGPPVIGILGVYEASQVHGLALRAPGGETRGLITWFFHGETAELVSIHASVTGEGIGSRLIAEREDRLTKQGVRKVVLATTNDNVAAFAFYQHRGYRLVQVHLDAMDRVRELKPCVPPIGDHDIPLRDILEFQKSL